MARFVSEAVEPIPGAFEVGDMKRGEPGLPRGFVWRGRECRIVERLSGGKRTELDRGEAYVRRHTFRLAMDDGTVWNVYFLRQPKKGARGAGRSRRWYLLSIEEGGA